MQLIINWDRLHLDVESNYSAQQSMQYTLCTIQLTACVGQTHPVSRHEALSLVGSGDAAHLSLPLLLREAQGVCYTHPVEWIWINLKNRTGIGF